MRRRRRWWRLLARAVMSVPMYALLTASAAVILFPLYLTVVDSLQPLEKLLTFPPGSRPDFWPDDPLWSNYRAALTDIPMRRYLLNSLIMASIITTGQLVTSALAAYAFAFLRFPFRTPLFFLFLSTMMVPWEVSIIPNFQTIQRLDWLDTYQGLTVPFLATAFGTFLLRQHFLTLPQELKDAADIEGYGNLRFLLFVVVPLSRAALATLAVFSFLQAWNQYLWPLLVTNEPDMRTVQIGIAALQAEEVQRTNVVLAGTIVALLPMLLLVVVFQRFLVRGLTAGAVKG
ncbi:MAG TPA: carbohydrate ABC transporter permease [Dehalococcoidia bacterium]|jgi:ABC-type glycerol-3-phosphate transport system permease component|nr:carbohydrate ABC transporter permease [Dehalococcoidia bacterium]